MSDLIAENVPKHIAIIMDGNGRWAQKKGEDRAFGHIQGVSGVREALKGCLELNIEYLTLYAFSTENWNRPKEEVDALMELMVHTISGELDTLNKKNVRLKVIGNTSDLPSDCRETLFDAIEKTSKNTKLTLVLALSYSSKWEIIEAVKSISTDVKNGDLSVDNISAELFSSNMSTKDIPDPEILIRTSGEKRISNFLLWQLAYSELFFLDILWPDFKTKDLFNVISDFQNRERRFGKTSAQIKK